MLGGSQQLGQQPLNISTTLVVRYMGSRLLTGGQIGQSTLAVNKDLTLYLENNSASPSLGNATCSFKYWKSTPKIHLDHHTWYKAASTTTMAVRTTSSGNQQRCRIGAVSLLLVGIVCCQNNNRLVASAFQAPAARQNLYRHSLIGLTHPTITRTVRSNLFKGNDNKEGGRPSKRRAIWRRIRSIYQRNSNDGTSSSHSARSTLLFVDQSGDSANGSDSSNTQTNPPIAAATTTKISEQERFTQTLGNLRDENRALLQAVERLEKDNAELQVELLESKRNLVGLETFEGGANGDNNAEWCDELQDGSCPVEPDVSFGQAFRDRAAWLVGLLLLQSFSGIILARNEALIADHPFIVYFLTMLVGAGGNAGNQASVRVIRGLALGTLNARTQSQFLVREFKMAMALSTLLTLTGFVRAAAFSTPFPEAIAVTTALFLIVFSSICLGAVLPLGLKRIGVDPAHSSTSIQVIMDILGVLLAVGVSSVLLDSPLGAFLISKLSWIW